MTYKEYQRQRRIARLERRRNITLPSTQLSHDKNIDPPRTRTGATGRRPCPRCGMELSELALAIHRCRIEQIDFPFALLPVGTGDIRGTFERHFTSVGFDMNERSLDWTRIEELERLNPAMRYCGIGGWADYGVFTFPSTDIVVLETPVRGNATYILGADWRDLISLTKAEIREGHTGQYRKIIHRGGYWRRRVESTLYEGF